MFLQIPYVCIFQYRLGADFRWGKSEFCAPLRAAAEGPTIIVSALFSPHNPFDGNYSHSFNDFIGRVWAAGEL